MKEKKPTYAPQIKNPPHFNSVVFAHFYIKVYLKMLIQIQPYSERNIVWRLQGNFLTLKSKNLERRLKITNFP